MDGFRILSLAAKLKAFKLLGRSAKEEVSMRPFYHQKPLRKPTWSGYRKHTFNIMTVAQRWRHNFEK